MSARQIIVLAIAAIAAIGALLLIRGMGSRSAEPDAAEAVVGEQVLVAARNIAQGAALTPGDLAVASFPRESVTPSFISISAQPSAQADLVGAVTRRAFVQGEPIVTTAVVQAEGRGFMAAQLEPGYRAVAIEIESTTAVGGYIQPNDRVDVIVTTRAENETAAQSDIVLQDVRVLALGDHTQTQVEGDKPEQIVAETAVLEMTADEARVLALADQVGDISLALRGVQAETVGLSSRQDRIPEFGQGNTGVLVHAFGIVSGGER